MTRAEPPPVPAEQADEIRRCLRVYREPKADSEQKMRAGEVIARFLHDRLFGVAIWRAGMDDANGLSARDLFQEAFLNLLKQFHGPNEGGPEDAEALCEAFCNLLYLRAVDHLRTRTRRPAGDLDHDPVASAAPPDRRLRAAESLRRLEQAVIWLDREHPRLSAAFKARLLANPNIRFSQAGRSFSRFVREQLDGEDRVYEVVGQLLGCRLGEARKRYLEAVRLLRERMPGLAPEDFGGAA